MTNSLLLLTLSGSVVFFLAVGCEVLLSRHIRAASRRFWWYCVPLAFLVAIQVPVLPAPAIFSGEGNVLFNASILPSAYNSLALRGTGLAFPVMAVWALGTAISLLIVGLQSFRASHRWAATRPCTDSAMLALLEDCKARAGVTAPISLVLTDEVPAPAILGWLRPRILLPVSLAAWDRDRLKLIFLHELAHFRALDVPVSWAFTLARCVHWFNPVAYLAEWSWARFREEAADEQVLRWSSSRADYGDTLLAVVRAGALPFGAIGISESFSTLKHRLTMINHHPHRARRPVVTFLIFCFLALAATFRPVQAQDTDPKSAAVAAMQTWLAAIDQGAYASSWDAAAPSFQKAITSAKWVDALDGVRKPLGACDQRTLVSAVPQTSGKHELIIAQFETSFANMKYALETVTFARDGDAWKAAGYYIKPR